MVQHCRFCCTHSLSMFGLWVHRCQLLAPEAWQTSWAAPLICVKKPASQPVDPYFCIYIYICIQPTCQSSCSSHSSLLEGDPAPGGHQNPSNWHQSHWRWHWSSWSCAVYDHRIFKIQTNHLVRLNILLVSLRHPTAVAHPNWRASLAHS